MKKLLLFISIVFVSMMANAQWSVQNSGTTCNFMAVYFTNTTTGFVCGTDGVVLKTTDAGATWVAKSSSTTAWLMDISFFGTNNGYMCGAGGTIIKTTDAGETWTQLTSGTTKTLQSIFFISTQIGYACGADGTIIKTINGGTTWTAQTSGTTQDLLSIEFVNSTVNGYAAGVNGTVLRTSNSGETWTSQSCGTTNIINNISFAGEAMSGFIVSQSGMIKYSENTGETWSNQTSGTTNDLYDIDFVDFSNGYVVGTGGTILYTTNRGTNWHIDDSGTTNWLFSVFMLSSTNGYAVGMNGTILKRINGGPSAAGPISGETSVCKGQTSVTYTVPNIINATEYQWTLPNGVTGNTTTTTNSITVNFGTNAVSGNISVSGVNYLSQGIPSSLSVTVNEVPPTPSISLSENILTSSSATGNQWYNQSVQILGAINQQYTVSHVGNYYTIVTINGCSSQASNSINITSSGIEDIENNLYKVFPNPFTDKLLVEFKAGNRIIDYQLINSNGQIVKKGVFTKNEIINTSDLTTGIYMLKVFDKNVSQSIILIKN